MFLKSIKWRLQLWYGLILVSVLTGFGFTAYQLERGRLLRRIDEELQRRAGAIANSFRPPMRLHDRGLPDQPPGGPPRNLRQPEPDVDEPGPEPGEFRLPVLQSGLFDETDTNGFYYVIWARNGKELARSANTPAEAAKLSDVTDRFRLNLENRINRPSEDGPPRRPPPIEQPPPQTRDHFRELVHVRPPGEVVLIGRSTLSETGELRLTALKLVGVGTVILLLGLAGGWWIASRAMQPIQDISAIATKISAGDLSQRINVADTENELGQLAGTLNSTFSRLEAAFVQQRQFTADAAHELRTPVAVILTETQATLKNQRSAEEYRQSVEVCQRITQRMRRLIESLFQLARLDAGQEQLNRLPFDLAATIGECVELVRPLAEERGIKIHCEVSKLECVGDAERISQVVTNLLNNALQYNKPDGEIRVVGQTENGVSIFTVADSGQGISAEDLPRVFERFYRADKSRSSANAGLGLAICKAIVEAHGGTIEVSSQPDAGTTFTVRLPSSV